MNKLISLAKALLRLGHNKNSIEILKIAANERREIPRSLWSYEIGPYESGPGVSEFITENMSPSIGYHGAEDPHFIRGIKEIFSNTPDNWIVIVVDDVSNISENVKKDYFKEWLASKNYPMDSKILVIGSSQFDGDYDSADWIAHDIIGHTVGRNFMKEEGLSQGAGQWISEDGKDFRKNLIENIMKYLRSSAPVSRTEDLFDMLYDILASIVLGHLDKETALDIAEGEEEEALVNSMFRSCQEWVDSIPSDSSKVTVIEPW